MTDDRRHPPRISLVEMAGECVHLDVGMASSLDIIPTSRGPCYAERRLAELCTIGRIRDLTEGEQREAMLRGRQVRHHAKRRQLYRIDPAYRERRKDEFRTYWRAQHARP